MKIRHPMTLRHPVFAKVNSTVQPIADRVAQNLEIILKTFPTNQPEHLICVIHRNYTHIHTQQMHF